MGIFGGMFDPPHLAHRMLAQEIPWLAGLRKLLVIPSHLPPHKQGLAASATDRLEMARLNFKDLPGVEVSPIEIRRGGISYTFDTVLQLQQEHPEVNYRLIVGLDALRDVPKWYRADELIRKITFLACYRPPLEAADVMSHLPAELVRRCELLAVPRCELSASLVRARAGAGEPFSAFVHPLVYNYIVSHGLYGTNDQ